MIKILNMFNVEGTYFNIARAVRQENETKSIQIRKEVKLLLFAGILILYRENCKDPTKKLLELVNPVKLQDTKSTCKNQLHFYTVTMNHLKMKF